MTIQRNLLMLLFGAVLYFFTAKIGMSIFSIQPQNISLLWLPFGIAVILVEKYGLKATIFIFMGSFFSHFNLQSDMNLVAIFHRMIAAFADSFAPVLSVFLIKRFVGNHFNNTSVLLPFALFAGIIPTLFSSTIISLNLQSAGYITQEQLSVFIPMIIYSDTLGLMILYPLYKHFDSQKITSHERLNLLIISSFGMAIVLLSIKFKFLIFLLYPLLLISTFRLRMKYIMMILVFLVVFTISILDIFGIYLFSNDNPMDSILMMSSFLATLTFIIIGVSLHNTELQYNKLLSRTDNLTKVLNRKAYDEKIKELFNEFSRYDKSFSIILLDIDNFKKINDSLGHTAGDKVLIDLCSLIKNTIRSTDYLYRMGGEEFVVLCSNTNLNQAAHTAEKIRTMLENKLKCADKRLITVSIGVTQATKDDNKQSLYKRVDELQYISKKNGKNKVTSK